VAKIAPENRKIQVSDFFIVFPLFVIGEAPSDYTVSTDLIPPAAVAPGGRHHVCRRRPRANQHLHRKLCLRANALPLELIRLRSVLANDLTRCRWPSPGEAARAMLPFDELS
jgi:hypothetical protein